MIRRFFAFLLAAICVLSQLTGCTPTDRPSSENPVTLTIWHVYGSQTKSPFNTAIDEFNNTVGKENGITVNVVKDGVICGKMHLELPEKISGVIECRNPRCITSTEQELPHIFKLVDREQGIYRCLYCESKAKDKRR